MSVLSINTDWLGSTTNPQFHKTPTSTSRPAPLGIRGVKEIVEKTSPRDIAVLYENFTVCPGWENPKISSLVHDATNITSENYELTTRREKL